MINKVIQGDCLEKLKDLESNSIDSIVTDPPYELGFMGKSWDNTGIANNVDMWKECLRVLKPGGHLLAFSGTRTYHRMASAIEDAGFEVRDMIEWVYGSGFPKSLNIAKQIDKQDTNDFRKKVGFVIKQARNRKGLTMDNLCDLLELNNEGHGGMVNHYENGRATPTLELWEKICEVLDINDLQDYGEIKKGRTEIIGEIENPISWFGKGIKEIATTEEAKQWEGWGTALKPAHEPICMARKPIAEKTVAENCLKYGTGGINIDESRVEGKLDGDPNRFSKTDGGWGVAEFHEAPVVRNEGRFPANLIHDNSEEVRECFPESGGGKFSKSGNRIGGNCEYSVGINGRKDAPDNYGDSGNASRFFKSIPIEEQDEIQEECTDMEEKLEKLGFLPEAAKSIIYQAKASKSERNKGCEGLEEKTSGSLNFRNPSASGRSEDAPSVNAMGGLTQPKTNNHPTVKPIALMEYLIKMVTPKKGIVLDPFAGSGSTLVAAKQNGFQYVGIEMTEEYIPIIEARLQLNQLMLY